MTRTLTRAGYGRLLLAVALLLASFNIRITITSLGPLLLEVMRSTAMTTAAASLLTALPSLCFGLFAPLAPPLSRRMGLEQAILAMMLTLAAGTALRIAATPWALFAGAIVSGAAIGVVNVLLPILVKRDFSDHVALMTGLYTMVLAVGEGISAAIAVPVALASGSWAVSLAAWAIPAVIAALAFVPTLKRNDPGPARVRRGSLWKNRLAWQVTIFMGLQSTVTYCAFGWLAPILRARGMSAVAAGLVLSVTVVAQIVSTLGGAPFASRFRDQRTPSVVCFVLGLIGFLGCVYAPLSLIWASTVVMGIGQGALFSIALMVIVLRSPDAHTAADLSGMSQCIGYILASLGSFALGLTHQWRGNWSATGPLIIFFTIVGVAAAIGAGQKRFVPATA